MRRSEEERRRDPETSDKAKHALMEFAAWPLYFLLEASKSAAYLHISFFF